MCFMGLRFSDSGEHVSTFNTVLFKQAVWDDLSFVTWCVIQQVAGDSTLWSLRHGHDQQHYSNRMWCLNDTQLILRAPNWAKKNIPHIISPLQPPTWLLIQGRMKPSVYDVYTKFWPSHPDSSDQETLFLDGFWWAHASCRLNLLIFADRSGPWCDLTAVASASASGFE